MSLPIPAINVDEVPNYRDLIRRDRVHGSLYTSAAVYRDELERIFTAVGCTLATNRKFPKRAVSCGAISAKSRSCWCVARVAS